MTQSLLLIGCGGHARSLVDIIESSELWTVFGFVGLPNEVGHDVFGYPVLGTDRDLPVLRQYCSHAVLAVGQIGLSDQRHVLVRQMENLGYTYPVVISNNSYVSKHATLSCGTTVGHGVTVNAGVSVGCHSILNSKCLIEHDAEIGDFCHISTGVLVNGGTKVGSGSFIGSGSILREGLNIPPNTLISAGTRVMGWPIH